jgi:hypothetical protein
VQGELLHIYLNDHLAGSTVGVELARRTLSENRGNEYGAFLEPLLGELQEDRASLEDVMARLAVPRSTVKVAAGWTLEKLGRLKLNGRITSYSPLSRLVELEGLAVGIEAKRALWLALAAACGEDHRLEGVDLAGLAQRAKSQRERLEPHRLEAAKGALAYNP